MKPILLEPTDVLFFRDAVPMSAGQGKGAGCRLPFPSTLHEALRTSLLLASDKITSAKDVPGRPSKAPRKGNWHAESHDTDIHIASKAYCSLRTVGPFPWTETKEKQDILLPVPLDVAWENDPGTAPNQPPRALRRLQLLRDTAAAWPPPPQGPETFVPPCLPVATTPPDKHGQLHGWWTSAQFADYLKGETANTNHRFGPLPTERLWQAEHRIGVQINPGTFAAEHGQLYAGSYLRAHGSTRFVMQAGLSDPRNGEADELDGLQWLLLGGEQRLARLWHKGFRDPFADLAKPPIAPAGDGACLLKWVMVTPAIFAHGSLPGWCWNSSDARPAGQVRLGASARKSERAALPGRAQLISWCLGKPLTVSGWDFVEQTAKPTRLALPVGSVYYFLCENRPTASALAKKLHWQPRSDFYGEKGCGYGLASFDVQMHPTSPDVPALANELLNC
jgi:CRISPR type III-B/RAMP module-associated protein Cmr3